MIVRPVDMIILPKRLAMQKIFDFICKILKRRHGLYQQLVHEYKTIKTTLVTGQGLKAGGGAESKPPKDGDLHCTCPVKLEPIG